MFRILGLGSGSGCFSALGLGFKAYGVWGYCWKLMEVVALGSRLLRVWDVLPGVQGAAGLWENIIAQRCVCVYIYIYIHIYIYIYVILSM